MPAKFFTLLLLVSIFSGPLAMGAPSKPKESTEADDSDLFASGTEKLFRGDYAAAEKDLRAAVRADDKLAEAHNNLAFVLRKQGSVHFDEALKHYNRAIELNDKLAEAYMYRGLSIRPWGRTTWPCPTTPA
jgi:Tfp pilus assembly protein PilF